MLNFRHKINVFLELQSTAASFITGHQSVKERNKSWEFVEEADEFVEAGEFMEEVGEFVEAGEFMKEAGEFVEEAGEMVEASELVEEAG